MLIVNITKNTILADQGWYARSFIKRLIGLLVRDCLKKGEALILDPSNSIHSFFMRFTFDALFIDRQGTVIGLKPLFKPFCLSPIYFKASITIELPSGVLQATNTQLGDVIQIKE